MRIVFLGTPAFAASVLEHIVHTTKHEVVLVVSKPDAPVGRGQHLVATPVKEMAQRLLPQVEVFQPQKASDPKSVAYIRQFHPDVGVVVAYGEILKPPFLEIPRFGSYNIHASLLPAYRGAAPIQRSLMDGCSRSGVTIFRINIALDSGDIVWQEGCSVGPDTTAGELTKDLLELAKRGIVESLERIEAGSVTFHHQPPEEAISAPKIVPEDLILDPTQDILRIHDRIRALSPTPGAYFFVQYREQTKRLKVFRSHIDPSYTLEPTRWSVTPQGFLGLATPEGTLVLDVVQLEGRSSMASDQFLRGVPLEQLQFLVRP